MLQKYCEQCGIHTLHDDEFCTVCYPFERRLTIVRESGPEVGDGDYANELEDDDPQPARLPGL